jgi:hypothetical protein
LQRLPQPLDPAFGLGRAGGDETDAERVQHPPEVRGVLRAPQLFRESPVGVVAEKHVEPVAVKGQRHAVLGRDGGQQGGVAVQILRGPEVEGEHGAGGVVDGPVQAHGRPAPLEPVERAGVDLHQGAHAGAGLAARAILPGPAAVLRGTPQGLAQPPDRGPADRQPLDLLQFLRRMAVIEVPIRGRQQPRHLLPQARAQPARRRPAAPAVQQPLGARGLEAAAQAPDLSLAELQGGRRLAPRHPPCPQRLEQPDPRCFLLAHCECLP